MRGAEKTHCPYRFAKNSNQFASNAIFPQVAGFLGKKFSSFQAEEQTEVVGEFTEIHEAYCQGQDWEVKLAVWAHKLDFREHPVQLISQESLSQWTSPASAGVSRFPVEPAHRREVPRRGAHPVAAFLAKLREFLPSNVSLFTIVTLRNQAGFVGSLTAQGIVGVRGGGAVIDRIIQREDALVDFYSLVTELEKVSGPSQHLTLLFEDGVEQNFKNIVEFAGLTPLEEGFNFQPGEAQNVRAKGDNTWQRNKYRPTYQTSGVFLGLRKVILGKFPRLFPAMREINRFIFPRIGAVVGAFRQTVRISDGDRASLQVHCAPSNERLSRHLRRDLASLGY